MTAAAELTWSPATAQRAADVPAAVTSLLEAAAHLHALDSTATTITVWPDDDVVAWVAAHPKAKAGESVLCSRTARWWELQAHGVTIVVFEQIRRPT